MFVEDFDLGIFAEAGKELLVIESLGLLARPFLDVGILGLELFFLLGLMLALAVAEEVVGVLALAIVLAGWILVELSELEMKVWFERVLRLF